MFKQLQLVLVFGDCITNEDHTKYIVDSISYFVASKQTRPYVIGGLTVWWFHLYIAKSIHAVSVSFENGIVGGGRDQKVKCFLLLAVDRSWRINFGGKFERFHLILGSRWFFDVGLRQLRLLGRSRWIYVTWSSDRFIVNIKYFEYL